MSRKLTSSTQTGTKIVDGEIIGCHQAQVWDEDGKSFAIIEPTINESEATATALLFSKAFEMEAALIEISEGKGSYDTDQLKHAGNCISEMKQLAIEALSGSK